MKTVRMVEVYFGYQSCRHVRSLPARPATPVGLPAMQSSNLRGILSMIMAVATFSVMDVTMKRLVETYPAMQVTFLRAAASLPFLLLATGLFGRWSDLVPRRVLLHVVR